MNANVLMVSNNKSLPVNSQLQLFQISLVIRFLKMFVQKLILNNAFFDCLDKCCNHLHAADYENAAVI